MNDIIKRKIQDNRIEYLQRKLNQWKNSHNTMFNYSQNLAIKKDEIIRSNIEEHFKLLEDYKKFLEQIINEKHYLGTSHDQKWLEKNIKNKLKDIKRSQTNLKRKYP